MKHEILFVDVWMAPSDWENQVADMGITVSRVEPQPIADQTKLHGCEHVPGELPKWLRRLPGANNDTERKGG